MLKLAGALCILLSGTLFGFFQAQQLSRRPKQIRQLIQALQRMETEISYGFTQLPEALDTIARQTAEPLAGMFREMAAALTLMSGHSVKEVWQSAVSEGWKKTSMKEAEKEILLQIGFTLGLTDRED